MRRRRRRGRGEVSKKRKIGEGKGGSERAVLRREEEKAEEDAFTTPAPVPWTPDTRNR